MSARLDLYNDFDPDAAAWLQALIGAGAIPQGKVDQRSILDVQPAELSGFRRVHLFAGIGGWAEALRLADWPDWLPVWTGSPPCQPFSAAGKGEGRDDQRHLAPQFARLVGAGRPAVLFGEQVASADVVGPAAGGSKRGDCGEPRWAWVDDLFARLEAAGYAAGAIVVPAAGVGAPHIRHRTFFGAIDLVGLGYRDRPGLEGHGRHGDGGSEAGRYDALAAGSVRAAGASGRLADGHRDRCNQAGEHLATAGDDGVVGDCAFGGLADNTSLGRIGRRPSEASNEPGAIKRPDGFCDAGGMADVSGSGRREERANGGRGAFRDRPQGLAAGSGGSGCDMRPCPADSFWSNADWLHCRDGKWRPVEPGTFPLAHGVSGRVGLLRGYGNAIVPQAAAEAVCAFRYQLTKKGLWAALERRHCGRAAA